MNDFFKYLVDEFGCKSFEKNVLGRTQILYFNNFLEIKLGPYFPRDPVEVHLNMKRTDYRLTPYILALHCDLGNFRKWLISRQHFDLEETLKYNAQVLKTYGTKILNGDKNEWAKFDQINRKFCKKLIHTEFFDLLYSKIVYL